MYDEFEVSKNVSEVFKKGENLVDQDQNKSQPNLSADIIEYSKQCKISGVVPNPKILKLIQDNCLLLQGYNLFSHATALSKFL